MKLSSGRGTTTDLRLCPRGARGPLSRPSGYSRRGDHSPRLCFRTVRERFPSSGSAVLRPWSWAPGRAGDRHVGASPSQVIPPALQGGLTASAALLVPLTDLSPSPRQPIRARSPQPWLLGASPPVAPPVDPSSALRARRDDAVPHRRWRLHVGPHAAPGVSAVSLRRVQPRSGLLLACWPKPSIRVGSSHVTTIPPGVQPPRVPLPLCSTGCPVGCRVTARDARFWDGGSVATQRRRGQPDTGAAGMAPARRCSDQRSLELRSLSPTLLVGYSFRETDRTSSVWLGRDVTSS